MADAVKFALRLGSPPTARLPGGTRSPDGRNRAVTRRCSKASSGEILDSLVLALQIQQWAAGGAFVLLGLPHGYALHRRRRCPAAPSRSPWALGAVGLVSRLEVVTDYRYIALTDLSVTLFLASGWAFLLFRHAVIPLRRWILLAAGATVLFTDVLMIAVSLPSGAGIAVTPLQLAATMLFGVVWLGCVGEPIVRLFRLSFGVPAVQRARLRALTVGYAVIIVILILSVAASYLAENLVLSLVVSSLTVVAAPFLYVGFAPPKWLRRSWREPEESRFRSAVNDLLLYSPDRVTLAQRALEWAVRLVGADGGVLATADGAVLVTHNMAQATAWEVLRDLPGTGTTRGLITAMGDAPRGAIAVPLESGIGRGVLAVTAGPLTPVFGEDEIDRLQNYAAAVTTALDRVHLVERLQRNVELLDLAYDAILTWDLKSRAISYWRPRRGRRV